MTGAAQKTLKTYGSWVSPITSDLIVSGSIQLGSIQVTAEKSFWLEGRPTEGGRYVLVQRDKSGEISELTPAPFNVRTRVHEYGGGAYLIDRDMVYFTNFADQQLYRFNHESLNADIRIIPGNEHCRYANMIMDVQHNRLIAVMEDHSGTDAEASNSIVAINPDNGETVILTSGCDFYSSPVLSPDGSQLAWMCWDHPNMPWDESEIWLADIDAQGLIIESRHVSGGEDESTGHPIWSPDGNLYFVSDRKGWWNICLYDSGEVVTLYQADAEFGSPHWAFGQSNFVFRSASELICTALDKGESRLLSIKLPEVLSRTTADTTVANQAMLTVEQIQLDFSVISNLQIVENQVMFLGASPTECNAIVSLDLTRRKTQVFKKATDVRVSEGFISVPEVIEFPTGDNATAHGFFYAPVNNDFDAEANELPPLLVFIHGGPTGATNNAFSLSVQYWTSRGVAVLDVNYRGSSGYGRAYRNSLYKNWGVVDTEDCISGANYLVQRGDVDVEKLAIRGGSAGGYTTLAALTFSDVFKAGASYYGVSDLEALARDTHKFESRYLDRIIGPYPQQRQLYRDRSPINHTDKLTCPVIFFQGLDDKVVPPNQTEMMVNALREKGLPVAYVPFKGEQHGFRIAANIKRALDAEYYFYSQIFGFELAEKLEPVIIENL
ncbi:MAG: dipeptidyl aminopeptidase/acylaminoacyl peptidase [Oceanicoccus sp.]|jgi:dipeptidyl aminopeptidase/acylaminoacyl peptidase